MSRRQLIAIGTLSLLITVAVLVQGGRPRSLGLTPALLRTAAAAPQAVEARLPAGAEADGSGDAADTSDDGGDTAAEDPAAEEEPAAGDESTGGDTAGGDTSDDGGDTSGDGEDSGDGDRPAASPAAEKQPTKVRHVFVIALQGRGFDATFGPGAETAAPYLNRTLRTKGVLLSGYRSLASAELPDHLALVGGQPPNASTRANCPVFKEIPPTARATASGELRADGCVFPNTVLTLGDQLSATRRSWRAYVEDLDRGQPRRTACRRPDSNAADDTLAERPGDGYATRRNPWVYFHSLLDLGDCDADDGPLPRLEQDLRATRTTASYSWIAPNLCHAGTVAPCADGSAGGLAAADAFLAQWAPKVLASPAYEEGGLLVVLFAGDAATAGSPTAAPAAGEGPRNGALLVSRFAKAGTTAASPYDPYAVLRSVEDLFALRPLVRAAKTGSFAPTVLASAYREPPGDG